MHESQIFRGQIAYAMIIQTDRCAGWRRASRGSKYQIFRGQMTYVTIMKTHKWMAAGAREAQIPKSPRPDDLCYDIEKSQVTTCEIRGKKG